VYVPELSFCMLIKVIQYIISSVNDYQIIEKEDEITNMKNLSVLLYAAPPPTTHFDYFQLQSFRSIIAVRHAGPFSALWPADGRSWQQPQPQTEVRGGDSPKQGGSCLDFLLICIKRVYWLVEKQLYLSSALPVLFVLDVRTDMCKS
jgi:hypothetical protein